MGAPPATLSTATVDAGASMGPTDNTSWGSGFFFLVFFFFGRYHRAAATIRCTAGSNVSTVNVDDSNYDERLLIK